MPWGPIISKRKKSKSVQENATHQINWDFETRTDHEILARKADNVNKKKNY